MYITFLHYHKQFENFCKISRSTKFKNKIHVVVLWICMYVQYVTEKWGSYGPLGNYSFHVRDKL